MKRTINFFSKHVDNTDFQLIFNFRNESSKFFEYNCVYGYEEPLLFDSLNSLLTQIIRKYEFSLLTQSIECSLFKIHTENKLIYSKSEVEDFINENPNLLESKIYKEILSLEETLVSYIESYDEFINHLSWEKMHIDISELVSIEKKELFIDESSKNKKENIVRIEDIKKKSKKNKIDYI